MLKLTVVGATAQVATISKLELQLPRSEAFAHADQTRDRSEEIKVVEGW